MAVPHVRNAGRAVASALLALGMLIACAAAGLGAQRPNSVESLAAGSDAIVHGLVLSAKAKWVDDARGRHIYTYASIRCHSWLKGAGGAEALVEVPGGLVGEVREQVTPGARLSPGEEVVFFLKGAPPRPFTLAGWHAGKFLVERGAAHGPLGRMPLGDLVGRVEPPRMAPPDEPPASAVQQPVQQPKSPPAQKPTAGLSRSATGIGSALLTALAPAAPLAGWTTVRTENFDGAWPNGWALYGNIGDPAVTWAPDSWRKRSGTNSGWPSGSAADAQTSYMLKPGSGTLISRMTYGPFDLRGTSDARVTFWTTYELDVNDKLRWQASKDGTTFYGYFQGAGNTLGTWNQVTFDLKSVPTIGDLCGRDGVYFRLQCDSAAGGTWVEGPFVDDILIEKYVVDNPPDLAVDSFTVTPRQSTQGTTLTASVTVRNAGTSAVGAFAVDFYRSRTSEPGGADAGDYTWNVGGLAAGASTDLTWVLSPAAAAGTHHAYVAIDRSNALTEYDESNNRRGPISYFVTQTGWQVLKVEDFEGAWPNEWSVTSNFVNRGTWAPQTWLASDTKAGGGQASLVDPASDPGTIESNGIGRMTYGPFSLAGATDARVTFFLSDELGTNDKIRWAASTDGVNFYGTGYTGGGSLPNWTAVAFDLKAVPTLGNLCGQQNVYFRLSSEADAVEDYVKGPFVDDIVIERYGVNLPWIGSITPSSGSAGTNSQVTIAGTGFGATQGLGAVKFFFAPGNPKISASIISWSDTSIVCTVPADASSGPVTVINNAGGESNNYTFAVTFSYGGVKWSGASPTVGYRVNENTADCTGEGAAVQAGAATWTAAGARFALRYDGATSATAPTQNGVNEIFWGSTGGPLGLATTWSTGGTITEADITFDDSYTWSIGGAGYDVQTIATHELGHWLKLGDLYGDIGDGMNDKGKILYGNTTAGVPRRDLAQADRDGIIWIYGAATSLGISVSPTSWAIAGIQPPSTTCLTTSETRFTVQNTGNVTETLRLRITNQDSQGKWQAGSAIGSEQYWLRALFVGEPDSPMAADFGAEDTVTTSLQAATTTRFNRPAGTYGVSMAVSAFAYLWFRLDLPSLVTDGLQHQITVEVSCETP